MSIQSVQMIGPQAKVEETKKRKGGGALGGALGGVVGGVAGGVAGGLTAGPAGAVQGAIGGAAAGHSVGTVIGEKIKPTREASSAIVRRAESLNGPQIQQSPETEKLRQSILALQTQPPEIQQQYAPPLVEGYVTALAKANPRGGSQGGMA